MNNGKFNNAVQAYVGAFMPNHKLINEVIRQYQQGLISHYDYQYKVLTLLNRANKTMSNYPLLQPPTDDYYTKLNQQFSSLYEAVFSACSYHLFDSTTVYQIDPLKVGRIDEDEVYLINTPIKRVTKSSYPSTIKFNYRAAVTSWIYTYGEYLIAHAIMAAGRDNVLVAGKSLVNATQDFEELINVVRGILTDLDDKCREINQRSYARAKAKHLANH